MRSVRKLHLWSSLPSHASAFVELSAIFGVLDLRLRKAVTRLAMTGDGAQSESCHHETREMSEIPGSTGFRSPELL